VFLGSTEECRACVALREQVASLKDEINFLRQRETVLTDGIYRAARIDESSRPNVGRGPKNEPVPSANSWNAVKTKLEAKHKANPAADRTAKYWADKVAQQEKELNEIERDIKEDASNLREAI